MLVSHVIRLSCDQAGSRMCCNILAGTVSKTKMGIGWLNACVSHVIRLGVVLQYTCWYSI